MDYWLCFDEFFLTIKSVHHNKKNRYVLCIESIKSDYLLRF